MDLIDNKLVVSRQYEWQLMRENLSKDRYYLSEIFNIQLDEISTKWQIVLYYRSNGFYAYLHKVSSSSNDFKVNYSFSFNAMINERYAPKAVEKCCFGYSLKNDWIRVATDVLDLMNHNYHIHICILQSFTLNLKITLEEIVSKTSVSMICTDNEIFLNSENLSDFKFICSDDTKIFAHRFILATHSPVLRAMLDSKMTESIDQMTKLDDIDGETMMEFLRFLYAGKVENIEELAPNLLYCADKYEVHNLKKICIEEMIKNLSVNNVLDYLSLADRFDSQDLVFRCVLFIKRNYKAVCQKENRDISSLKFNMALSTQIRDENLSSLITLGTLQSSIQELSDEYTVYPI